MNQPILTKDSESPMRSGDEAGPARVVVSRIIKGPMKYKRGSAKVKVEGKPIAFQTCVTGHNGSTANIAAGAHYSPSQSKVSVSM